MKQGYYRTNDRSEVVELVDKARNEVKADWWEICCETDVKTFEPIFLVKWVKLEGEDK